MPSVCGRPTCQSVTKITLFNFTKRKFLAFVIAGTGSKKIGVIGFHGGLEIETKIPGNMQYEWHRKLVEIESRLPPIPTSQLAATILQ